MENSIFTNSCKSVTPTCLCFDKLSPEEMDLLLANQVELTFKKGDIICKQGSLAPHVILLTKGLVKAYIESCNCNLVLKIISSGKFLALSSAMAGNSVFHYSTQAYVDSTVMFIDINIFRKILRSNPDFATEIFNIQSGNAKQIYGRFFCLTQKQSYGRLADLLLCLADNVFYKTVFKLELTRKDLAELSGLSQESVVRILKSFKDEKLISTTGKLIEILDYEKLQKISLKG
jgi:CRP/FNR family transcriptional regulator